MPNARLDGAQTEIQAAGRNINNLRYAYDTTLMAESKKELEILLMKLKEESEKPGLKLSILKTKIMASGPTTSWQIDGETMETVTDFIYLGSKINEDSDWTQNQKTPWKKSYDKHRQHIKKQRYNFAKKGPYSQSYDFSSSHVSMWELDHEGWALRNCCFQLWCWRRLLRVPWTARRSNWSILKGLSCQTWQSNFSFVLSQL